MLQGFRKPKGGKNEAEKQDLFTGVGKMPAEALLTSAAVAFSKRKTIFESIRSSFLGCNQHEKT
ncbi:MAG: hypothetical protein LBU32_11915 [Clostridiales bacterium]|jgi:hypothetical protein|nr:hypothetical protein [Clostridiales bacterium]